MKFHYAGKYVDEESLPKREHPEGYVPYNEPQDMKKFTILMSVISIIIFFVVLAIYMLRLFSYMRATGEPLSFSFPIWTLILFFLSLVPHEFLHAIWFRDDVEMYQNLRMGTLFVIGTEDMSKGRFILMSLFPNIIFGFIPFFIYLLFPKLTVLGFFGVLSIAAGAGDFFNVYNCINQVPKGGLTYLNGMHSFWYMPHNE